MSTSNIERFDQLTGRIFADLYEAFPMPRTLSDRSYSSIIEPDQPATDGKQSSDPGQFFTATITWLVNSGYITTFQARLNGRFTYDGCVLTAKGLEVLKSIPSSVGGKSFGQSLQEAAKAGSKEALKKITGEVLSFGLGVMTKLVMTHVTATP